MCLAFNTFQLQKVFPSEFIKNLKMGSLQVSNTLFHACLNSSGFRPLIVFNEVSFVWTIHRMILSCMLVSFPGIPSISRPGFPAILGCSLQTNLGNFCNSFESFKSGDHDYLKKKRVSFFCWDF